MIFKTGSPRAADKIVETIPLSKEESYKGNKITANAGRMSIESLQDSHTYHSRDKESGIHLQRDITARPDTGKRKWTIPTSPSGKRQKPQTVPMKASQNRQASMQEKKDMTSKSKRTPASKEPS